jgi:hypothetical protein
LLNAFTLSGPQLSGSHAKQQNQFSAPDRGMFALHMLSSVKTEQS